MGKEHEAPRRRLGVKRTEEGTRNKEEKDVELKSLEPVR